MFVILGIVVLIVSFVIALVSLVAEQRKTELLQKESEQEKEEEGEKLTANGANLAAPGDLPEGLESRRIQATKHLEDLVEKQKATIDAPLPDSDNAQVQLDEFSRRDAPVDTGGEDSSNQLVNSYNIGDQTEELKLQESGEQDTFNDTTQPSADSSLSGMINMREIAKAKKSGKT